MSREYEEHLQLRKELKQARITANIISFFILAAIITINILRVKGV